MRRIFVILGLLVLSSCALFASKTQEVTINTASGKPANCVLKNDLGEWQVVTAKPVKILKSQADLKVRCVSKGLVARKTVKAIQDQVYPKDVTVHLRAKKVKKANMDSLQKEEDDEGEDDSEDNDRPLNVLREGPADDNDKE